MDIRVPEGDARGTAGADAFAEGSPYAAMHIPIYEQEGYEADDILGSLSKKAEGRGPISVVVSGDRDLLQIAGETLKVRIPKQKPAPYHRN